MPYTDLTVCQAFSMLDQGEMSTYDYVGALLARCEHHRGYNAFICQDADKVMAAARSADKWRAAGTHPGALLGVPIVLKDNIDTAQYPTTGGTLALKNHRPTANAPLVKALLDAGAIIFGKANLHELAHGVTCNNYAFGAARNPYDHTRICGGSSGGCGVAVAARLAPAAIGTDTGGSVRIPAALCGIVGFRPSMGRYPQAGIVPISHTRDTAGPMTRTVRDAALLDNVITRDRPEIRPVVLKGLRLGVPRKPFYNDIHPEVSATLEAALARFAQYGLELVEADLPGIYELDEKAGFPIALYEVFEDLGAYLRGHGIALDYAAVVLQVASPDVKTIMERQLGAHAVSPEAYQLALRVHRPALQAMYADYFAKNRLAAMVFPTTPMPAVSIGEDRTVWLNGKCVPTFTTFIRNTSPGSVAGIPGLSMPAGLSAEGLPIGLELDAPFGRDAELLSMGMALEKLETPLPPPSMKRSP